MKVLTLILALLLFVGPSLNAQQNSFETEKLVGCMRLVNTLEAEYRMKNKRFADVQELLTYTKAGKQSPSEMALTAAAIQPYTLRILTSADGQHYLASIKFPSDMHQESTWCKTDVFSDDSGLISLGQNIQCSATRVFETSPSMR